MYYCTVYCYCASKYCEPMMRCCHGVVHVMNHVIMSTDHCPHGWAHVSSVSSQPLEEESQIMQTSGHLHSAAVVCFSQAGAGSSVRFLYHGRMGRRLTDGELLSK